MEQRNNSLRENVFPDTLNRSNLNIQNIEMENQQFRYSNEYTIPKYFDSNIRNLSPKEFLIKSGQRFQMPLKSLEKNDLPIFALGKYHPNIFSSIDNRNLKTTKDYEIAHPNKISKATLINNNNHHNNIDILIKKTYILNPSTMKKKFINPLVNNANPNISLNDLTSCVPNYGLSSLNNKKEIMNSQICVQPQTKRFKSIKQNNAHIGTNLHFNGNNRYSNYSLNELNVK